MDLKVEDTTNVALILLKGTIHLPKLLKGDYEVENQYKDVIVNIKPDKMNKSTTSDYCLAVDMRLSDSSIAKLTLYAPKIIITGSKELDIILESIKPLLLELKCKFEYPLLKTKLTINFFNCGDAKNIQTVHSKLVEFIDLNIYPNLKIDYELSKIHVKGLRHGNQIKEIGNLFIDMFSNTNIAKSLNINSIGYIMSNCNYKLGFKINIWNLANLIRTVDNFKNAIVIYDNIGRNVAHSVMIILPLAAHIPKKHLTQLHRNNIEASFKVNNTGYVTQSSPSRRCNNIAHKLFLAAIVELGANIVRLEASAPRGACGGQ